MNLFVLAIHLLFFPFGNDGYTSRSWDWVIGFGACQTECDKREEGYTCRNSKHDFMHCSCWDCQRDCQLSEAKVNIDYCDAAASHVAQVGVDVDAHLASLSADLAIRLSKLIPYAGPVVYPILRFGKGLFDMGKDEKLLNNVIADVNARLDTMNKCMGQQITKVQVEDQIDSMQGAFILYDQALSHQGSANDDELDKLRSAWQKHLVVAGSEFDNVDKRADFFSQLLLPMQDFAQSFVLVSFDYLILLHRLDKANYENAYESTIDAFVQLRTWADRARVVIKSSISDAMHTLPCKNGQAIENQKNNWNAKFLSTNVYPIDSYLDRLAELNNAFTGDLFSYLGCYKDKGGALWDRAMVHMKNGVTTTIECWDLCMRNGYSLFGLQYPPGGQCFCSNDKSKAMQFGESDKCDGRGRGGIGGASDIYQINGDIECANGYYPQIGDIPGSGIVEDAGFGEQVHNCNECSKLCSDRDDCLSYECSKTELKCNLNSDADPLVTKAVRDYAFCTKNGDIRIGNVDLHFGVKYAIKSVSSGQYLDGRSSSFDNPLLTNRNRNPEGNKFLHWIIVETNVENQFALKSVSSGRYLNGRKPHENNPLITNRDPTKINFSYLYQWTFQKTNGGANNVAIKSVSSRKYLDGRSSSFNNPLLTNRNPMDDRYLQWQFIAQ